MRIKKEMEEQMRDAPPLEEEIPLVEPTICWVHGHQDELEDQSEASIPEVNEEQQSAQIEEAEMLRYREEDDDPGRRVAPAPKTRRPRWE